MDKYGSFPQLKKGEREGVDFRVDTLKRESASTTILAPHGGGIEPGTSEVARGIAGDEASLALFEGTKPAGNYESLHIKSTNFNEPRCMELVQAARHVLTIHGENSNETVIFLGGRDSELGKCIQSALERRGYAVKTHRNPNLQGTAPTNVCNRGVRNAGVQLELSHGLRLTLFESLTSKGRMTPTLEFAKFVETVREGLRDGGAL